MIARIIYNPTSGRETFKFSLSFLIDQLVKNKYTVEVAPTQCAKDAANIAASACESKIDLLVVSGGDGTLHEVINGIANKSHRPVIGYIPSGTTNDFASAVGIPTNIEDAVQLIFSGVARKMDIGRINDNYFMYVACFGAFTKVSYTTPSKLKSVLGHLAYVLSGVPELPKLANPTNVEIITNDTNLSTDVSMFFVVNSTRFAGAKDVLPDAKLNDGLFDVIMVNGANIIALPEMLKSVALGVNKDINQNGVMRFETNKVVINSKEDLIWNLDGELGLSGNVEIECLQEHIRIIVPKRSPVLN